MDLDEFKENYLNFLLDTLSKENKSISILGDFILDLLKYESHAPTIEFLDPLSSNMFLPYILQATRVTYHSKTLIDNILSNLVSKEAVCGNVSSTKLDHLPQFLIMSSIIIFYNLPISNLKYLKEIGINSPKKNSSSIILIKTG